MESYQLYLNRIFALGKMDIRIIAKDKSEIFSVCAPEGDRGKAVARKAAYEEFVNRFVEQQSKLVGKVLITTLHGYSFCGGTIQLAQGECYLILGPFYIKSKAPSPDLTLQSYDNIAVVNCFLPLLFDGPYDTMLDSELRDRKFIPMDETVQYNDELSILKNHELETQIRKAIYAGDLKLLREIRRNSYFIPPTHYDVGDQLRAERNASLALNTLASRAAADAGVSASYVRSLCAVYAGKIERVFTQDELYQLRREFCEHYCRLVAEKKSEAYSPVVKKCIDYMRLHLQESLTLEMMANYTGVSYAHLSRLLKKECGKSYSQLLNSMRLERAMKYLSNGLSIQETAERTGFNSSTHFCHTFKSYKGCTPTQWLAQSSSQKK